MSHVVLVGLMGVGKTTIGKRIATRLGMPFVDGDAELERRSGQSVRELFTIEGEEGFRQREAEVLDDLLRAEQPTVIAAGGGVVVRPENRERLRSAPARVIYLRADPAFLATRVTRKDHRPLLDGDDPAGALVRLAAERDGWYREVAYEVIDVQEHYLSNEKSKAKDRIAEEIVSRERGVTTVSVSLGDRTYDVLVGAGAIANLGTVLPPSARRAAVVTQAGIGVDVDPGIEHQVFTISDGEEAKSLATVEDLCRHWARWGLTRGDVVVAVGGGVVTDTGGFAAAVYHRGVALVHVPTTLLGMVDAAIGGKTGVNLPEGKNLVGAFWQPRAVVCDTDTLRTLPPRELRSGWGEVAKYHFLTDEHLDAMDEVQRIAACVRIKADVVSSDEREGADGRGRAILNYGHTLAHALETAGQYDLRHGEAVGIGLVFAAVLAERLGRIDDARVAEHRRVVDSYGLPTAMSPGVDLDEIVELMRRDKKALDGLTFVLDGPDGVEVVSALPENAVRGALEAFA
jgi:5-deoxy-5-amino-3-dehydroquinate synthase